MTTHVELTYGELSEEALLEAVGDCRDVQSIDLSGNNINGDHCIKLAEQFFAKMPNLESLDIKDNNIGPKGAICLFEVLLKHCPKLTYLDVNENAIQDEAMYALAVLVQGLPLRTLNVVTNHITPRGLPTLCDGVLGNSTLEELSLAFNVLGDEGAKIAADMLGTHPSLRSLNLSDNSLGDEGAVAVAKAFILGRHSRLTHLDLSVNHIGDIGFGAIGEALTARGGNANFVHVDLGCNDAITDDGRAALVSFAKDTKYVQSIDLTSCDLSDADAQALASAIASPRSSLCTVEWFNNPRMSLAVEKDLFESIQRKEAAMEAGHRYSGLALSPNRAVVAAVGVATVVLAVMSLRRRSSS